MLDLSTLKKYDSENMHNVYDIWPEIAKESFEANHNPIDVIGINHIVFAGMGGSGTLGDIFSSILSKIDIHVSNVKGYLLPKTVNSNSLVVTISVSGDTIETLSVLDSARKSDCKVIAFSSGGKMKKYCLKNGIEYRCINEKHSPRASLTSFLFSMINILEGVVPIKKEDALDSINQMKNVRNLISSDNLESDNPSLSLASWLSGVPLIYYPFGLQAAAIRFKNSLQENAKIHALTEDVIEACHNGIVAWEKESIVKPILLQGHDDYIKTNERWKILKEYFKEGGIDYHEVFSEKGSILSKLINLIYLLDFATIYHAVLTKVDPTPVKSIDFIKKESI